MELKEFEILKTTFYKGYPILDYIEKKDISSLDLKAIEGWDKYYLDLKEMERFDIKDLFIKVKK